VLQLNLFEIHLQLFGNQHRDRGVGALTHLDIGHDEDNPTIAFDTNDRVGGEAIGIGRSGFAVCDWQAQAQHQSAARCGSGLQKAAPREAGASGIRGQLIEDHVSLPFRSLARPA